MNNYDKFKLQVDMHRWEEEMQRCETMCIGEQHGMKCADCGIRRFGPHAEHGNYHYFTYEHLDGVQTEFIPPCGNKALEKGFIIDTINACKYCGYWLEDITDKCNRYYCVIKNDGKSVDAKKMRLVRKLDASEKNA